MKRTVFVTQVPNRRDKGTGAFVPVFNISPAIEHGEIEVIMPPSASFYNTAEMVKHLRQSLVRYNYAAGDSIVPAGDPAVIMAAGAIVAERNKSFRILKWDKSVGRYVPIDIHL